MKLFEVPNTLGQKTGNVSFESLLHFLSLICPANSQIILQYAGIFVCHMIATPQACSFRFKRESNHVFDRSQLGEPNDCFLQNN